MQKTISSKHTTIRTSLSGMYLILLGALVIRIVFACTYKGFSSDTACFYSWASMLWENGFNDFYSADYFCDYPPGYLYILYLLGGLLKLFHQNTLSGLSLLILKLPAILCDLASGCLIWKFAGKNFPPRYALILSAGYLFHPAVLINSSLWGQVDAIYTLVIILVCILLSKKQSFPAYLLFALGILLKPQTLMFSPLILCSLTEDILSHKSLKKAFQNLAGGIVSILILFLCCLPFGLEKVFAQYTNTLTSYPYAAVNACNIWGLFGQNWISQDTRFLGITYAHIGVACIILITFLSFLLFFCLRQREERFYLTAAFLIISMFLFSIRMHERYLFPAMLLLLFAYIHNKEKLYYRHYWCFSFCHFFNVCYVLYGYNPADYDRRSFPLISISLITVIAGFLFYSSILRNVKGLPCCSLRLSLPVPAKKAQDSDFKRSLQKADILIMTAISLIYGLFAFMNLGLTNAPVTKCAFPYNTYLELEAMEGEEIESIYWYLLNEQNVTCRLEVKETDMDSWTYLQDMNLGNVFSWSEITLPKPVSAVRITNLTKDTHIGELVFTDRHGQQVSIRQANDYYPLFDETDTFPGILNAQSCAYFDEIYYTRTAYEFLNGLPAYENTHPPLGKILIALGTLLFGTTPFGFRFMGTLAGILMLPFLYLLGRNITKSRFLGGLCSFLFAFDFMHFTQTRLATIDVFVTFFIIIMYFFMEQYLHLSRQDISLKKTWIPLGICGIAFGFGLSCKWTGAYAGLGLAILFFQQLCRRFKEKQYLFKTIGFCMIFFVAIPFCIYLLSYIPFVDHTNSGLVDRMLANQVNMFNYHSQLTATHAYASSWYQWPTMIRPVFYYAKQLEGSFRLGISAFGNPLVWWMGIPVFFITFYLALFRKDSTARFLIISYLAQYLPWTLVDRCTFLYHYFPSIPFVVLMLVYCLRQMKRYMSSRCFYVCCISYGTAVFILFLVFYPVLAGTPVSTEYVARFLRWFDSWVLVLG